MIRTLATALLASSALLPCGALAQSLPSGGDVVRGEATIHRETPNAMKIRQTSDRAVINWQDFSVAEGARVDILQNDARSALLNRVTGDATSTIAGQISANGQVFLVNPNGILITKTGNVKAAGFVASTLDLSDDAFMAGDITVTGYAGNVTNAGTISIVKGGYAALIGGRAVNSGTILAPLGKVAIGSATRATLDLEGDGFLQVALPAGGSDAGVYMPGRIVADGGAVLLAAGQAREAARGVVNMSGSIEARGLKGRSGSVTLTGGEIALTGATIDASGTGGGGSVRIGGDWQGQGTLNRAATLNVDSATTIRADALNSGDGGRVVLWSDQATQFAGSISARGAGQGKGGDAEVSGKALLNYTGTTDLRGPGGFGTLLLDPYNITISDAAQTTGSGFTANGDDSVINIDTLTNALEKASVTVMTGSDGSQAGNITLSAPISWTRGSTLTLKAAGGIALNGSVIAESGSLTLNAGGAISATGDINVNRFILESGNWAQNSATLPGFAAKDFRITGGSFLRAAGGTGVSGDAWALTDIYGVQGMATLLSGHFMLANDVDASGTRNWNSGAGFSPVGTSSAKFTGGLDGTGHVITELRISRPAQNYVGLIGDADGARISRVGLVGGSVKASVNVGMLIGRAVNASISDAYATGTVNGDFYTGGLLGYISGSSSTITSAYATGRVTGGDNSGGLIGSASTGVTISNAYATGSVVGARYVGGLAGYANSATLSDVYATGSVSGNDRIAGLVGGTFRGSVNGAYATGSVSGGTNPGGLIGFNFNGETSVTNAYWDMDTTHQSTSSGGGTGLTTAQARTRGGYAGFDFDHVWYQTADLRPILRSEAVKDGSGTYLVSNLHQLQLLSADLSGSYRLTRDIDAYETAGGNEAGIFSSAGFAAVGDGSTAFDGILDGAGHVVSQLNIDRSSQDYVGLIGATGTASKVSNIGLTDSSISGKLFVGGLIGANLGEVSNAYVTATVSGSRYVGGLIGFADPTSMVDNVHANGKVSGTSDDIGGLIGRNNGSVGNAYASGAVNGDGAIGGLVGTNKGTVRLSYATGAVNGTAAVGGLIGSVLNGGSVESVYATGAVSGTAYVGGLIGANSGALDNAYATGRVRADSFVGGLVGYNFGTVTNGYWDTQTTGQSSSAGGAGLSTAQFQSGSATGLGTAFAGGKNGLYPYLASFHPGGVQAISGFGYGADGAAASGAQVALYSGRTLLDTVTTGANGYYYTIVPTGTFAETGSGLGQTIANDGTVNGLRFADSLTLDGNGNLSGLSLRAGMRHITTDGKSWFDVENGLYSTFGDYFMIDRAIGTSSWDVSATNKGGFIMDGWLMLGDADFTLASAGDLTLYGSIDARNVTLSSAGVFTNDWGSDAISATGRWLIYLPGTANNKYGGLDSAATAVWGTKAGAEVSATGNRYVFAEAAGTLTFAPANASKTYGDTLTLGAIAGTDFTVTGYREGVKGAFLGDTAETAWSGMPVLTSLGTAAGANAGDYALTVSGVTGANGYAVDLVAATLKVGQRGLTVTADDLSRIYGEANPALTYSVGGMGLVNGDTLSGALATDATAKSNVGNYGIGNGTLDAGGNYAVTFTGGTLSVTQRGLTVTADDLSRIYGEANPALTYSVGGMGLVNGDTLSGALATDATAKSNVGNYGIGNGTLDAGGNYAVTFTGGTLSVTQRGLTVTADDLSRIYGEANPALTYSVGGMGLVNGDTLSGALATDATAKSNVGKYGIGRGTLDAGSNYALTFTGGALSVTQRGLTVTADDLSRIYGEANPALTYSVGGMGLVNGDTLSGALATDATAKSNVGNYGIAQGTLDAGSNYALTFTGGTLSVTPRGLTVTADDLSRIYGEANPALTYSVGGMGLVNGDTLSGVLATDATAKSNVGNYGIAQGTLDAGGNYAVTFTGGTLSVTQRGLTVTADDLSRIYGEANPVLTYSVGGMGLVNGDTLSGALATDATAKSNVGNYAIGQGTLDAGSNYALTFTGAQLSVTPRGLTVTADDLSRIYGEANPALTYSVGGMGLVNGDTLSGALATDATAKSNVGNYAIAQGTLDAGSNYALTFTGGALSVTQRGLTVTADDLSRIYGEANPALTYSVGGMGLVNGDTLSGALATDATAKSNVGNYGIAQGTLHAGSNYALTFTGGALSVTPRGLTVTADDLSRIYGEANPALTYSVGGMGLVNGDTLSGALATDATATSDAGSYAINQGTLSAGGNYALTYEGATLTVTAAPDRPTVPAPADPVVVAPAVPPSSIARDYWGTMVRPVVPQRLFVNGPQQQLPTITRDVVELR